jgi:uncharacterized repeat protein (TIGR01451 family)/MYXO-CTERM domain-containing protein
MPVIAAPTLRVQVDQRGDFVAIGNTLGWDCGANPPTPVVGTVPGAGACGSALADTAPDVHWQSDDPGMGATASTAITSGQARSTAVLDIPATATVTHAFLYWGAKSSAGIDATVNFEKMDGTGMPAATLAATAAAADQFSIASGPDTFYQSVADVTAFVQAQGEGPYRVWDVGSVEFVSRDDQTSFAAWSLIVFYEDSSEPARNLVIFDGLDQVQTGQPAAATLAGFLVPMAGYDAKLGVITYEGDSSLTGDQLRFGIAPLNGGDALADAINTQNNFFNATRSLLGVAVSVPGDLPQLTGDPASMGGYDLDVVDITDRVTPGQTSADIEATSSQDLYLLGAFVTSISTYKPDLSTSLKEVEDADGGALLPGDQLRFRVIAVNNGNDNAIDVVMTDPLPNSVTFVADSVEITDGPNAGALTDMAGDDQGEYDSGTHTLTVRLGTGADAVNGGTLGIGESTTIEFLVTVNGDANGTIENQALLDFAGEQGSPPEQAPTDGNGDDPGAPPTEIPIDQCETDDDCPDPAEPACDTEPNPNECVECIEDVHCTDPDKPVCDTDNRICVECVDDNDCPGSNSTCDTAANICVCEPQGDAEICGNDIDEDCDGELDNGCGCVTDSDCAGEPNDGIVCHTESTFTCGPGCRGVGQDAGCPTGQTCTSIDESVGECVPNTAGIFAQGGCSCTTPGQKTSHAAMWLGLALCSALFARRRRR